jgi:2-keto-3-deoxy-L-rhamnonate aldolase RhmA
MGKDVRQKGMNSWKSQQTLEDVSKIRAAAPKAHLLVRINPLHDASKTEIDQVVARGADSIMLPMFHDVETVARIHDFVDGRAELVPLAETKAGLYAIPEIIETVPLERLHIGLNDLHLDMKYRFMFQPIAEGILETACQAMRAKGVAFGIGGVARANEGIVSPEYLLGEHVRLGSDAAILSRSFHRGAETLEALQQEMDFAAEVQKLLETYDRFLRATSADLEKNRIATADRINDVVTLITKREETSQDGVET